MPRYFTRDDIIAQIGESDFTALADRDADGIADSDVVDKAIRDAETILDSFVGHRYSLPLPGIVSDIDPSLNVVPAMLVMVGVDIAVYRLSPDSGRVNEETRNRHAEAMKWLRALVSRTVTLGVAETAIPPTINGGVVRTGPERLMTREGLKWL